MPIPNIKEEIRKLAELQGYDKTIFDIKKELAGQPKLIQEAQAEFEVKKTKLKALEDNKQKLLLKQKEREVELGSKEENIKKSLGQMGQLKTNKEYQAKLTEIEGFKADKSLIEEEILKLMDASDNAKKDIEAEKKTLEADEKIFNEKKNAIANRAKDIEGQLQATEGKRKILAQNVDQKILTRYEHILQAKEGMALVAVSNNSCHGCFMHVPHQVINEIRTYDRLITCETCSRILYIEEDVNA